MDLPVGLLQKSVEEGKVYFFRNDCPIGIKGHMHVCIKVLDKVYLFSVCTSQMATIRKHAELAGISLDTYPSFPKDELNKFDADYTFVNCNDVVECSADEFVEYLESKCIVPMEGVIDDVGMEAIAKGIKLSKTVAAEIQALF